MIQFDDFSFSYGDLSAPQLKNFDFIIQPGEFVLLCGASACGKTTAAKCINGLIPHFTPGQSSARSATAGASPWDCAALRLRRIRKSSVLR